MAEYTTRPAQFRLPPWAQQFLAEEASSSGATKTEVVLAALGDYKRKRFEELMREGYEAWAEEDLAEAKIWECTLMDGLEPEEW